MCHQMPNANLKSSFGVLLVYFQAFARDVRRPKPQENTVHHCIMMIITTLLFLIV